MLSRMKMFRRVFILRGIAATDVSAGQAQPQVDPRIAHFQTFLAAARVRLHVVNLIQMRAFLHAFRLP